MKSYITLTYKYNRSNNFLYNHRDILTLYKREQATFYYTTGFLYRNFRDAFAFFFTFELPMYNIKWGVYL